VSYRFKRLFEIAFDLFVEIPFCLVVGFKCLAASPLRVREELVFVFKRLDSSFAESSKIGVQSLNKTMTYFYRFEMLSHLLSQKVIL
jgi:hypothetical protein